MVKKSYNHFLSRLIMVTAFCCSSAVLAADRDYRDYNQRNGRSNTYSNNHADYEGDRDHRGRVRNTHGKNQDRQKVKIQDSDRAVIKQYVAQNYRSRYYGANCPPGLARKNNGCLPPGHAVNYKIGQPLPKYVSWRPVPRSVMSELQSVPRGYKYVVVDDDVLLMSENTHEVIDAITRISTVRN